MRSACCCVCQLLYIRLKTTKYCIVTSNWSERVKIVSFSFILALLVEFPWFLDNSSIALVRIFMVIHFDVSSMRFYYIAYAFSHFLLILQLLLLMLLRWFTSISIISFIFVIANTVLRTDGNVDFFYTHQTTIQFMT